MSKSIKKRMANCCADEVLQEIWRIKDTLSASYGHDVKRLFADLRKREKLSGHRVVNLQDRRKTGSRKAKAA
jgi:hypothetical protein